MRHRDVRSVPADLVDRGGYLGYGGPPMPDERSPKSTARIPPGIDPDIGLETTMLAPHADD